MPKFIKKKTGKHATGGEISFRRIAQPPFFRPIKPMWEGIGKINRPERNAFRDEARLGILRIGREFAISDARCGELRAKSACRC
jgi:hypothetical protein